jgi:uncharacterized protein (DUF2252 family)
MSWATPDERRNLGQSRRKQLRRQENNQLNIKARKTNPLALLERAERGRVPALLKLKRRLMAQSPFFYFRGTAAIMASDLALIPNTGIEAQICGDAHVRNLGAFAAPDGRLVFDINDFDETIRGPFEWDLKRMAASLVLAGRESRHKESSAREAVQRCIMRYSEQMRAFARLPLLEVARFQVHRLADVQPVHQALLKAERATPLHNLDQLTEPVPGKPGSRRFKEITPNLARITGSNAERILGSLAPYREMLEPQRRHLLSLYRPVDVAFKVVGTGSIGLRDYCIYLEGNGPNDPLFLQMKEAAPSAYTAYLPNAHPCPHNGQRVVIGQRAMQLQSDPFLGWTHIGPRHFLVRQLNDHKGSIDLTDLARTGLAAFGEVCGELLARGHARSGDPLVIAGYLGNGESFAEALAHFGSLYADQTEKDWQTLRCSGRFENMNNRLGRVRASART